MLPENLQNLIVKSIDLHLRDTKGIQAHLTEGITPLAEKESEWKGGGIGQASGSAGASTGRKLQ